MNNNQKAKFWLASVLLVLLIPAALFGIFKFQEPELRDVSLREYRLTEKSLFDLLSAFHYSPQQEFLEDFMAIMHYFSAKLYFLRKYEKQIIEDPI